MFRDDTAGDYVSQEEIEQHDGIFGIKADAWDGRLRDEDVPEGLYRYDLRGSDYDPGQPITVEKTVVVNHAASVLMAEELDLGAEGRLELGEEGLNFTGAELTVREFIEEQQQKENDEVDLYRTSYRLNSECKQAIHEAIADNYDGMYLGDDAVDQVVRQYGMERVGYILANTLHHKSYDDRFSHSNKEWAEQVSTPEQLVCEQTKKQKPDIVLHDSGALVAQTIYGFDSSVMKKIERFLREQKPELLHHQKFLENGTAERAKESGTEQNYNMIDGCVNNNPKKPRIIGNRISVLDRLHIKLEERKQKSQPQQQQQQERSRKN